MTITMAPGWSIKEDSGHFFLTNAVGQRLIDIKGKEYPRILNVSFGNKASELLIKFEGLNNGKRMLRELFRFTTAFSQSCQLELENCVTNGNFLTVLYDHGLDRPQKPPKEGSFKLDIDKIKNQQEEYIIREVNIQWVQEITEQIKQKPASPITRIPVLVTNVQDIKDFQAELLEKDNLCAVALGGNHLLESLKSIAQENDEKYQDLRKIDVDVYVGLTHLEAKKIAVWHNNRCKNMPLTFQDTVRICRDIYQMGQDGWKEKVLDVLGENHGTGVRFAMSIAKYTDQNYRLVMEIFHMARLRHGESYPQQLFRNLSGMNDESITKFLKKATGTNGLKVAREIKEKKLRGSVTSLIATTMNINDSDVKSLYTDEVDKITEIAKKNCCRKRNENVVPRSVLTKINELKEKGYLEEESTYQIKIEVTDNEGKPVIGKKIEDLKEKYKRKMAKDLAKIENNIDEE